MKRFHYVANTNGQFISALIKSFLAPATHRFTALQIVSRPHKAAFSTAPTSVSNLLQRQTCLFVCFTATAHLVCRQRWEKQIENPSPVGICSPCLHLMSPKRLPAWKSLQSQIKAELAEHVSKLSHVVAVTSGVDLGQSRTGQLDFWMSSGILVAWMNNEGISRATARCHESRGCY